MRALTGIKPTAEPHLGNLLGAIVPGIQLSNKGEAFYFVADYHAFTTVHDRNLMRKYTLDVAASWLACGLDPKKACLFVQSDVPEVTELTWFLTCMTGMGLLERGHAYKAALEAGGDIKAGIFNYPVLMAADILIYDSTVVPVGKDQKQHVEMARDMAQAFNAKFGKTFVLPDAQIQDDLVVPGIDGRKMSKSYDNHIPIFCTKKERSARVSRICTDSKTVEEPKDPDTCNIFGIYKHFATAEQQAELAEKYRAGNFGYGHAKAALLEVLEARLAEPRARYEHLQAHPEEVEVVLQEGAVRARTLARSVLSRVRDAAGFRVTPRRE